MKNRMAGFTLIETVLVLLIAALIIGGIWIGYSQVRLNQQVNDTIAVLDQTLQVTRDYLATYSAASGGPQTLSQDLYSKGLMPPQLSYETTGASSPGSNLSGVNSNTAVFISPLGTEFFVQSHTSASNMTPSPVFEIRIAFISPSGDWSTGTDTCLLLLPKLVGTMRIINDRSLYGWWMNQVQAYPGGNGSSFSGVPGLQSLTQAAPTAAEQLINCSPNNNRDIRLYFSMRP